MDKVRLLPSSPLQQVYISTNNNSNGRRMSFIRRLGVGCIILAALGLLYVPAYHSAQGPLFGIGEVSPPAESLGGGSNYLDSTVVQISGWTFNTSRDVNLYINPDNNTAITSPELACGSSPPYLLIIVCSAVGNQKARTAIRSTWGSEQNLYYLSTSSSANTTVKVVFLLGESTNDTLNAQILDENYEYGDIIQEKFIDTYNNLTLKSVMMLKWVTTTCPQATYLMKTDDDMYVNVPGLVKVIKSRPTSAGTLMGSLICNARPISDPKNKWYTPKYMFSEKTYPNYLSGTGYVMSLDVASKLYATALKTPLLHLEDVYLTGLCAKKAKLRPVNNPGFSYIPRKFDYCVLKNSITAHKVDSSGMYEIWNKLQSSNVTCPSSTATSDNSNKKSSSILTRHGRHINYYLMKKRINNRCS
ncbi:beta-1,3-galactosyltransferase 1-like isoform X1 [Microplitis mediator]|uniref:beta-1,3-galactosyltransferase 1-like isoform X1 n=1 Tax=Microplitis mediator TaxID=375433 RepID=UPI002555FAA1|nr:beta-1,3-galactosyltransferase 1-like isoform X1 [Microplitis mediator]